MVKHLHILLLLSGLLAGNIYSTGQNSSIHKLESEYYSQQSSNPGYIAESNSRQLYAFDWANSCKLEKMVFGYHPYWLGNAYLNYRWDLLSDLCYFSYEVNPATGLALTTNGWETAPVIDSAQAHGVRVHLCVTLFNGHYTFFASAAAQQTLIDQIIIKMKLRHAKGVNLDVEALPSSAINSYNAFLVNLATQVHQAIPGSIVSIAAPAVDWNNELQFQLLANSIDYYIVMAYDYYWNGSSQAGPIAPLYPMTSSFNYSVKQSIIWYLSKIPASRLVIGLPYYGRDWPVEGQFAPSNTLGSANTMRYKTIRNNSATYSPGNLQLEPNSLSPYYSYFTDKWHQCFIADATNLGLDYDQINSHNLAGAGIWALGYDDGYPELWQLIGDKLTSCKNYSCTDTLYDSGGPTYNYHNTEQYTQTFSIKDGQKIRLEFLNLNIEKDHDTLWVFDGSDTLAPLLAGLSGNVIPSQISASRNTITVKFKSDSYQTAAGWKAVLKCPTASVKENSIYKNGLEFYPNPAQSGETVFIKSLNGSISQISLTDINGRILRDIALTTRNENEIIPISINLKPGIYLVKATHKNQEQTIQKLLIR